MAGVIILSPGRSGSSLVAGIFAAHGLWTGNCRKADRWNRKGYFENNRLKNLMIGRYGRPFLGPYPSPDDQWVRYVKGTLKTEGHNGEDWLYKCGAVYWQLWEPFEPVFVKVWRPVDDILASYDRCRFLSRWTPAERRKIVERQHDAMRRIEGPDIDSRALVAGNYTQAKSALRSVGLRMDVPKIDAFIDRRAFHEAN